MYDPQSIIALNELHRIRPSLVGGTIFTLGDLSVEIKGKDSIGNLVQEWLGAWFIDQGYNITRGDRSQDYPDFYIGDTNQQRLLEVKVFNARNSPAFDIANFEAYCTSLARNPHRLLSDYLILSYSITNHQLQIENIWLKKIWEITGTSSDYPLKCQVKYRHRHTPNEIYNIENIRPITWYSTNRTSVQPFQSREHFVDALYNTQHTYRGHSNREEFNRNYDIWQNQNQNRMRGL
ncbi:MULTISPECIES: NgoBV family restriction endonuclease [unclassified Psychrobacter]|uniref:NgoBV family restriction endonuclease n=1 Tax=unclassified Psychrobacter TaxID=196806 RepID=UPI0018F47820|nr:MULTISPECIES: NgoBV family restriction endonuclease [unclassified Psychrobacter]